MNKILPLFLFPLLSFSPLMAVEADDDFEASLKLGAFPYNAQVELQLGLVLNRNCAANVGVRLQKAYYAGVDGKTPEYAWSTDDELYNFLLPLSLNAHWAFRQNEKEGTSWLLFAEPGVILQPFSADHLSVDYLQWQGAAARSWTETYSKNYQWLRAF